MAWNTQEYGFKHLGDLLRHVVHACPAPPADVAIRWRQESHSQGDNRDAMGLQACAADFPSTGWVYMMVAVYPWDAALHNLVCGTGKSNVFGTYSDPSPCPLWNHGSRCAVRRHSSALLV